MEAAKAVAQEKYESVHKAMTGSELSANMPTFDTVGTEEPFAEVEPPLEDVSVDQTVFLEKLRAENAAMEAEIARLSGKIVPPPAAAGEAALTKEFKSPTKSIKLMNFGTTSDALDEAGVDFGSHWMPPQCGRRTNVGGFFSS